MLATLITAVLSGLRGELIRVEVDVAPGLPVCHIVGLPDAALSEARERVRGAIRNSGFEYPMSRITVNLAPADRRKRGAGYDLAIAIGILAASGQIRSSGGPWALLGELSLGGELGSISGVLPMVATLSRAGYRRVVVPETNLAEAHLVEGVTAVGVGRLEEAARLVAGPRGTRAAKAGPTRRVHVSSGSGLLKEAPDERPLVTGADPVDLVEIRGQAVARWALEVALAGEHNMLLVGPPGAGKTLLARAISGLLPPLSDDEALEVTVIESVAGLLGEQPSLRRHRPFRAPHHTSSYAALVGGGPRLAPGEVTLAHRGVLFLDELAEFDRPVLDALRQPLEEGTVVISRAAGQVAYPARIQLVAAMNPCRCGYHGDPDRACHCLLGEPERYVRRISGPLLDRLDLRIEVARVDARSLLSAGEPETSEVVRARIAAARAVATARNGGRPNARLSGAAIVKACQLDPTAQEAVADVAGRLFLSARGIHRLLRVARSIADLDGQTAVDTATVLAAAALRDPAGRAEPALAA